MGKSEYFTPSTSMFSLGFVLGNTEGLGETKLAIPPMACYKCSLSHDQEVTRVFVNIMYSTSQIEA